MKDAALIASLCVLAWSFSFDEPARKPLPEPPEVVEQSARPFC